MNFNKLLKINRVKIIEKFKQIFKNLMKNKNG